MMPAMEYIISSDQKGFMKNRRIAVNIRKVFDLLYHTQINGTPCYVLSVDFLKCFDMIEIRGQLWVL